MKKWLFFFSLLLSSFSYADQLAYISKAEAESAVVLLSKVKSVYLFCGCCSMQAPVKVKPTKVYSRHTGYENYYEVVIEYVNEKGDNVTEALDLAYVWKKKFRRYKTIGSMLNLPHDACVQPKDWNRPENNRDE